MKTFKLIMLSIIAILFASCKASQPTGPPSGATPSLFEVTQILDSTQSKFISYSILNSGNAPQAIMQTTGWLQSQPNVQLVTTLDSDYISIVLKSGLHTSFSFDEIDSSGASLFKGGGPKEDGSHLARFGTLSNNTITNKNVLIYCPGNSEFYHKNELQTTVGILNGSGIGLNVTLVKDQACTYPMINTFQNYGFVIIDTHGMPDGFMIGTKILLDNSIESDDLFKASIVSQAGQDVLNKLLSGELSFYYHLKGNTLHPYWKMSYRWDTVQISLNATSKYIDELPSMSGTVLMGSMCFSGWENSLATGYTPIKTSFLNKNVISYYCFAFDNGTSAPVSVPFAKQMEDSLSRTLTWDLDSTKIANLLPDQKTEYFDPTVKSGTLYFKHFGADDYSYQSPCGNGTMTDTRDGHVYKTVCIGNQTWMAENLDYDASGSMCYDSGGGCTVYGRLYDWPTLMHGSASSSASPSGVQGVCPKGWHVPSGNEFNTLGIELGGVSVAGGAMKDTSALWDTSTLVAQHLPPVNLGATNSSGFTALPAGQYYGGIPRGVGQSTWFWTSEQISLDTTQARLMQLAINSPVELFFNYPKTTANSCRCVKDP